MPDKELLPPVTTDARQGAGPGFSSEDFMALVSQNPGTATSDTTVLEADTPATQSPVEGAGGSGIPYADPKITAEVYRKDVIRGEETLQAEGRAFVETLGLPLNLASMGISGTWENEHSRMDQNFKDYLISVTAPFIASHREWKIFQPASIFGMAMISYVIYLIVAIVNMWRDQTRKDRELNALIEARRKADALKAGAEIAQPAVRNAANPDRANYEMDNEGRYVRPPRSFDLSGTGVPASRYISSDLRKGRLLFPVTLADMHYIVRDNKYATGASAGKPNVERIVSGFVAQGYNEQTIRDLVKAEIEIMNNSGS